VECKTEGVSVVVPVYNEEGGVGSFLEALLSEIARGGRPWELLVVDDGSTDRTRDRIEAYAEKIRIMRHMENRGYGAAIKTGIHAARFPIVLIVDADGTYPTEAIPRLLSGWDEGTEMVVGARIGPDVNMPLVRRPAKWLLKRLAEYLSEREIPDLNSGLRAFRRETALRYIHILPNRFSFTTTITLTFLSEGLGVRFVQINYHKRVGRSKVRSADALNFLILIVRTITYFDPLRIFLPASLFMLLLFLTRLSYDIFVLSNIADTSIILFVGTFLTAAIGILADLIVRRR